MPGAYKEAEMVSAALKDNSFQTTLLLRGTSPDIIRALFSDDYKIIHLAGHGMFNPDDPSTSGMVIGNGVYLTTAEIAQMSMTPDMVFVNCCFLGKTEGVAEELYRSRYKLAANIGTQLIENGVKAVVVAGWAVDDAAAMDFTKIFYENMLEGSGFGDAVQKARKTIYEKYHTVNNTWGAYQCYGDPFYKFDNRQRQNKKFAPEYVIAEEAEIALHNLHNEIDLGNYDETDLLERLTAIAQAVDNGGLRNAEITGEEAFIYSDMYHYDMAVSKFQAVMAMEKADFSVRTLEKYCNVRAKKYVKDLMNGGNRGKLLKEMNEVITGLHMLLDISETSERLSLLGSTHKRKSFISSKVEQKITDLASAAYFYKKAHTSPANNNKAYSLSNWLEMESLLVLLGNRKWGNNISYNKETYSLPSVDEVSLQLQNLKDSLKQDAANMDYWYLLQRVNIDLCRLVTDPVCNDEDAPWEDILFAYRSIWAKAGSKGNKLAEIEHLEQLTDALSQTKKRDASKLKKRIDNLKTELQKMIPD